MNVKTIAVINLALLLGAIAILLFVPKHVDGAGKVGLFSKDSETNTTAA